jgi:hypothetical protein
MFRARSTELSRGLREDFECLFIGQFLLLHFAS